MRRRKHGTLLSGRAGKGGRVRTRKQAIAIGLSEARKKGAKVPVKKSLAPKITAPLSQPYGVRISYVLALGPETKSNSEHQFEKVK
jgi:hypothetical protein